MISINTSEYGSAALAKTAVDGKRRTIDSREDDDVIAVQKSL